MEMSWNEKSGDNYGPTRSFQHYFVLMIRLDKTPNFNKRNYY
jgi:hypothetical protein